MRAAGVRAATPQTAACLYYKFIEKDVKIGYTPYTGYGGITDFCITDKNAGCQNDCEGTAGKGENGDRN